MHDRHLFDAAVDERETAALVGEYRCVEYERYQGYGDSEGFAQGTAFWAESLVGWGDVEGYGGGGGGGGGGKGVGRWDLSL